jgi:hypothetical protein
MPVERADVDHRAPAVGQVHGEAVTDGREAAEAVHDESGDGVGGRACGPMPRSSRAHSGVAAYRMRAMVTAEFAEDRAETAVPVAAPQAARPTLVNTDGQLRGTGGR